MNSTFVQVLRVYGWLCGLDDSSPPEWHEAAKLDLIEHGGMFAWRKGADHFAAWFKHLYPHLPEMALTKVQGSDAWWWDSGLDRVWGLLLVEDGEWADRGDGVPMPPPTGMTFTTLRDGAEAAPGRVIPIGQARAHACQAPLRLP